MLCYSPTGDAAIFSMVCLFQMLYCQPLSKSRSSCCRCMVAACAHKLTTLVIQTNKCRKHFYIKRKKHKSCASVFIYVLHEANARQTKRFISMERIENKIHQATYIIGYVWYLLLSLWRMNMGLLYSFILYMYCVCRDRDI